MQSQIPIQARAKARDAVLRRLNRLTARVAVGALAGVGGLAIVSAQTIPGTKTASSASSSTPSDTSTPATPDTTQAPAPATLQPSSGVSSSSSPAHVVTGGS
jgi:hypothetical protein